MAEEKMTIVDLRKAIARQTETEEAVVSNFLNALFPAIADGLKKDKQVRINGLGTFKLQWVEPRKSVNISTGEPIIIDGYQKFGFTPEQSVKERINEPYANLEPVELDESGNPLPQQRRTVIDPLQKMDEQAAEIKDILADLGAATVVGDDAPVEEPKVEEPAAEEPAAEEPAVVEEPAAEESKEEEPAVVEEPAAEEPKEEEPAVVEEPAKEEPKAEEPAVVEEPKAEEPAAEEPAEKNGKKEKPFRPWLVALITILIFCIALICGYFFLQRQVEKLADKLNGGKIDRTEQVATPVEEPIVVPDSAVVDSAAVENVQDSANVVAENDWYTERHYDETLAIETVREGSRLTRIAERHYGNKECWVFIYEANRDKMTNPSNVLVGMKLTIPTLPDYLIDPNNVKSQQLIKQLQDEYLQKK